MKSILQEKATSSLAPASLNARYGALDTASLLRSVIRDLFPGRTALVTSFGTESAPLLRLVAEINPHLPILFLETGKHFAETLVYRDQLIKELGLTNVQNVTPIPEQIAMADRDGTLWQRDPDYCCHLRKVIPLDDALADVDCWITGRKRHHGSERGGLQVFESVAGRVQVNPLANWSSQEVTEAFEENDLPRHPLEAAGYRSIGCATCTFVTPKQGGARSGRWLGTAKNECGIHKARWAAAEASAI